jgi:plastocyanin
MCIGERAATSYLSVYPAGQNRPATSNLNFAAGQTIPNLVIVRVGAGDKVTFYNAAGTVNILADLAGYYAPGPGATYTALPPARVMKTLTGLGAPKAKLGAGAQVTLTIPGLPAGTTAVALNVTATGPTATSYLSLYQAGQNRPATSNLNFAAGQTIPNMVIVRVGAGNKVTFYNAAGYYAP